MTISLRPPADPVADALLWQSALRDLLHDCVSSAPLEQSDRLREARYLFAAASVRLRQVLPDLPEAHAFAALLHAEAYESAALALLGPGAGFMLSRGGSGTCMASVVLPSSEDEMTAEAATPALALLAAQLAALLAVGEPTVAKDHPRAQATSARLN